ncbi:MAG TPA: helix-turn-helix transcriptional regulator [Bacilli bacterium]|nr:helix-turn-helix transcriptional regulator [Bacilli bacterium]
METEYNGWFGKRLKEVMDHFNITGKSLEEKSGIGRMTIARITNGRYATAEEVRKLADAFGVSVERLKQKDVDIKQKLDEQLSKERITDEEMREAERLREIALGKTEIGYALLLLYYYRRKYYATPHQYEEFVELFSLWHDHEDGDLAGLAFVQMLRTLFRTERHEDYEQVVEQLESQFERFPLLRQAQVLETKGVHTVLLHQNYKRGSELFARALEGYRALGKEAEIRNLLYNMSEVEFRLGRLERSLSYKEQCLAISENKLPYNQLADYKDYAKVLLLLGRFEEANKVVEEQMAAVDLMENSALYDMYLVMHVLLTKNRQSAATLLARTDDQRVILFIRLLECYDYEFPRTERSLEILQDLVIHELLFDLD